MVEEVAHQRLGSHAHDYPVHTVGSATQLAAQPCGAEHQSLVEARVQRREIVGGEQQLDLCPGRRVGIVCQPRVDCLLEVVTRIHPSSLTQMTTDVLARIRTACAQVTAQATDVHIDHDRLGAYAHTLLRDDEEISEDLGRQRMGNDESAAAFIVTLDAINFGSGYFPYLRKRAGLSGYHTVSIALRDRVATHGPICGRWLRDVDRATCNEIFDQPDTDLAQELMDLFAIALRDLGRSVAPCLVAIDDEAYTYNNRVNRVSTIQEHFMIRRAVERGVSPERLAKALGKSS